MREEINLTKIIAVNDERENIIVLKSGRTKYKIKQINKPSLSFVVRGGRTCKAMVVRERVELHMTGDVL